MIMQPTFVPNHLKTLWPELYKELSNIFKLIQGLLNKREPLLFSGLSFFQF